MNSENDQILFLNDLTIDNNSTDHIEIVDNFIGLCKKVDTIVRSGNNRVTRTNSTQIIIMICTCS